MTLSSRSLSPLVERLVAAAPASLDLTEASHLRQVQQAAEALGRELSRRALEDIERQLVQDKQAFPLLIHLAVKLATSKCVVASIDSPVHVSVVFAVYKEHQRIRTKQEHEHGEDFLLRKINQLEWLFADAPNFSWDLTLVDDGDPENTGEIALEILESRYAGDNVHVLFLERAIREGVVVTRPMRSAADSQKGGSIAYGMWHAAQQTREGHIVVFTDADLSTHLGQLGLLIDSIVHEEKDAAIGSRRETLSVVVKKGVRNTRGKLFIYLWKRLIPELSYIVDSQCGFKAFTADTVRAVADELIEKKFAIDIELLLKTELRRADSIGKVPIAWIDSEALSTTTAIQPYLTMLKGIARMYRKYLPSNPESESFARFVDGLDEQQWDRLVLAVPGVIADADPKTFHEMNDVQVADLEAVVK